MDKKKILIVDDEPHIIRMVESRLQASGYETVSAKNGLEGLEAARAEKPDLIVLDISMPKMDGHETLTELKKDPLTKGIPVIMLTGAEDAQDIVQSLVREGAVDYIVKPYIAQTFLKKITTALNADRIAKEELYDKGTLSDLQKSIDKNIKKDGNGGSA